MSHLVAAGEISDETGMASTVLAREVGYPGTSIAFAQLLSGMERSGLIRREVRGKRTYRITVAPGSSTMLMTAGEQKLLSRPGTAAGLDYDELARRLLVQVVRELAVARRELAGPAGPAQDSPGGEDDVRQAGRGGGPLPAPAGILNGALPAPPAGTAAGAWPDGQDGPPPGDAVADLQRELASARALHSRVSAENARLREQLRAARRSLARLRGRAARRPVTEDLDTDETGLLDHLLAASGKRSEGGAPALQ